MNINHLSFEVEEMRREIGYLRAMAERSLARMMTVDAQALAIRHELEQKRRGFSLMADLAVNLKHGADYELVFNMVTRSINAALNMQHTAVLRPEPDGRFRPAVTQGYSRREREAMSALRLELDDDMLRPHQALLITGADPAERLAEFRRALALPFFIAAPVYVHGRLAAVLATGRQDERPPFLPRLGQSDKETVQTLAAYLAFMLTGQRLEEEEAEKHDLEEVMRTVFAASVDGYIVWNCGRIDRFSPGALKLLGLSDGSDLAEYDSLGLTEAHLNAVFKEVQSRGRKREELFLKSRGGELIPCEVIHLPLRLHSSACLLSYIRDLREQKAHEQALLAAKEAAEAAAVAKSEFLANISHEIRTPMNAIVGLAYLLRDSLGPDGRQGEYVRGIEEASTGLLKLVNDVLDYSSLEAGRMCLEPAPFSLEKTLEAVVSHNKPLADNKGLALILENRLQDGQPRLIGDEERLKRIINSLVDNAIKFTEKGSVTLSAEPLPPEPGDGGRPGVKFAVRDTGIGLSPEQRTRVFEAFAQADGSSTRKYGGAGLGLAVARQLVERFGGNIWCESAPGEGSTFYFTARFDREAAETGAPERPAPARAALKGRILLVEDNAVNQLVARKIMEKAGLSVREADNGRIALEMIEAEPFDLVFMDIQMPEMDGLTATRHIRANPKFAKLPIVAMTAHAQDGDKELSLATGMNDHITKPINLKELFEVLTRWLPAGDTKSLGPAVDNF